MIERKFIAHCHPVRPRNFRPGATRSFVTAIVAAVWLALIAAASAERSVTLAWSPSPDANVVGYRIQAREENAALTTSLNVSGQTRATLPGLKEGLRYTFTVTSYNAAGVQSVPSDATAFVVPVPLNLLPGTTTAAAKRLQFPMAPGRWYELQASTDLKAWTTVWQTGVASTYAWTEVQEPTNSTGSGGGTGGGIKTNSQLSCRFFRLQIH